MAKGSAVAAPTPHVARKSLAEKINDAASSGIRILAITQAQPALPRLAILLAIVLSDAAHRPIALLGSDHDENSCLSTLPTRRASIRSHSWV